MPVWCKVCNRSISLPHTHDKPKTADTLRKQKKIQDAKTYYANALDQYKQFLRLAIELCEEYDYSIRELEKIIGHKI